MEDASLQGARFCARYFPRTEAVRSAAVGSRILLRFVSMSLATVYLPLFRSAWLLCARRNCHWALVSKWLATVYLPSFPSDWLRCARRNCHWELRG